MFLLYGEHENPSQPTNVEVLSPLAVKVIGFDWSAGYVKEHAVGVGPFVIVQVWPVPSATVPLPLPNPPIFMVVGWGIGGCGGTKVKSADALLG